MAAALRLLILWTAAHFAAPAAAQEPEVPFVPTPRPVVEAMLDMAETGPDDFLIDLGSGDGRIAIAAGRRGARALGVELNPGLVDRAHAAARFAQVENRVRFRRQDLFETPLREASIVTLYLLPDVNLRLRPRLLTELRIGARVVSHAFHMGDWRPDAHREVGGAQIYMWIVPAVAGGRWHLTLRDGTLLFLEIEQRFQEAAGTATGPWGRGPLRDVELRGARLGFTLDGPEGPLRFEGIVSDREFLPDPEGAGERGWTARRGN